jgi:hypothetical protein
MGFLFFRPYLDAYKDYSFGCELIAFRDCSLRRSSRLPTKNLTKTPRDLTGFLFCFILTSAFDELLALDLLAVCLNNIAAKRPTQNVGPCFVSPFSVECHKNEPIRGGNYTSLEAPHRARGIGKQRSITVWVYVHCNPSRSFTRTITFYSN